MKLHQKLNIQNTSLLSLVYQVFIQTKNKLASENINNQEKLPIKEKNINYQNLTYINILEHMNL